jgi:hypothetical protein
MPNQSNLENEDDSGCGCFGWLVLILICLNFVAFRNFNNPEFSDLRTGIVLCDSVLLGLYFVSHITNRARKNTLNRLRLEAYGYFEEIGNFIIINFQVDPCPRCYESEMRLIQFSPNGNSLSYQCINCNKKRHAAALSSQAKDTAIEIQENMMGWETELAGEWTSPEITFLTTESSLPFEQTSRISLPESIRSEVWRRDMGKCTQCGSNQNLEFDHIIPISKGGSNSVNNLQLLCRSCNASKSNKI